MVKSFEYSFVDIDKNDVCALDKYIRTILRHTFATTALANGMDIKTLSAIIGHNSAETTLNIYTHITDEMQRTAANKIEQGIMRNTSSLTEYEKCPTKL